MEQEQKESSLSVLKDLIPLFAVEIVLLTLMNFANLTVVYRYMAIVLMIIAMLVIGKSLPRNKRSIPFLLQVVGLILFELVSVLAGWRKMNDFILIVSVVLGSLAFLALGVYYGFSKEKNLDFSKIISAIYASVGIYTLICLIATIYGMGQPFYSITFALSNSRRDLMDHARILIGFQTDLRDNGVEILGNFALLASTGVVVSLFTNRKDNPFLFYASLLGGLMGLATLILIPVVIGLALFIIILCLALIIKFANVKKKKLYIIICSSFVGVLMILYAIFRIDVHIHPDLYTNVNKVVFAFFMQNFGVASRFTSIKDILTLLPNVKFVGLAFKDRFIGSGSILLDILVQSGILPFIGFMIVIVVGVIECIKFIKKSDNIALKIAVSLFIFVYLIELIFNNVGFSIIEDFIFLGTLLLMGYCTGYNLKSEQQID